MGDSVVAGTPLDKLTGYSVGESNLTLFLLPFRYKLMPNRWRVGSRAEFEEEELAPNSADFIQREHYLTGETRAILFGTDSKASPRFSAVDREVFWYRLGGECTLRWYPPPIKRVGPPKPFEMPVQVRLVLFDRPNAEKEARPHAACGQVGFLIVRAAMAEGMSFADMLDFNAYFRLAHYQHPDQHARLKLRQIGSEPESDDDFRRYPGFDIRLPAGRDRDVQESDAWTAGCWADFLRYRVRDSFGVFELSADTRAYPDDRVYVASHACIDGVEWPPLGDNGLPHGDSRLWMLWHQFLYVEDGEQPFSHPGLTPFEIDWAAGRTYRRWAQHKDDCRLYGFSNFSFCSLCLPRAYEPPVRHFEQMYLDQLLLVLYQRVVVFAFGRELTALSQQWKRKGWSDVRKRFSELRAAFGQFVNLYWFPAFTTQVQGLEMYELARRELNNQELFDELRQEMDGTWSYLESQNSEALTRGGAFVASIGLVLAYFGISLVVPQGAVAELIWPAPWVWVVLVTAGLTVFTAGNHAIFGRNSRTFPLIVSALLAWVLLLACGGAEALREHAADLLDFIIGAGVGHGG